MSATCQLRRDEQIAEVRRLAHELERIPSYADIVEHCRLTEHQIHTQWDGVQSLRTEAELPNLGEGVPIEIRELTYRLEVAQP